MYLRKVCTCVCAMFMCYVYVCVWDDRPKTAKSHVYFSGKKKKSPCAAWVALINCNWPYPDVFKTSEPWPFLLGLKWKGVTLRNSAMYVLHGYFETPADLVTRAMMTERGPWIFFRTFFSKDFPASDENHLCLYGSHPTPFEPWLDRARTIPLSGIRGEKLVGILFLCWRAYTKGHGGSAGARRFAWSGDR